MNNVDDKVMQSSESKTVGKESPRKGEPFRDSSGQNTGNNFGRKLSWLWLDFPIYSMPPDQDSLFCTSKYRIYQTEGDNTAFMTSEQNINQKDAWTLWWQWNVSEMQCSVVKFSSFSTLHCNTVYCSVVKCSVVSQLFWKHIRPIWIQFQ